MEHKHDSYHTDQLIARVVEVGCAAVVEGGDVDAGVRDRGCVGGRGGLVARMAAHGADSAGQGAHPVEGAARGCNAEFSF